jgi:hypothetical protein
LDDKPLDDPFEAILKRAADDVDNPDDDPLDALINSGPKFDSGNISSENDSAPIPPPGDDEEGPSFPLPLLPFEEKEEARPRRNHAPSLEEIMGISSLSELDKPLDEPVEPERPQAPPMGNTIPDLPDDNKPSPGNPPQDDFLRMFPGARG